MSKLPGTKKTAPNDDDSVYVTACQAGNVEAFSTLVARHSKKMLTTAQRLLGDYEEACDATQDAFLAAYRAIGSFRAESQFSTWLYRIVVNVAKNRLGRRQVRLRHEAVFIDADAEGPVACKACLAACDQRNPEQALERREIETQVQKCLNTLDPDFRMTLVLRDIQGLSYDEIGDVLKIPDGTVKSRLARARLSMKDCLKKLMGRL